MKMSEYIGCLLILLIFGASWLAVCGVVKLITMLIGIGFSWAAGTSVWMMLILWYVIVIDKEK